MHAHTHAHTHARARARDLGLQALDELVDDAPPLTEVNVAGKLERQAILTPVPTFVRARFMPHVSLPNPNAEWGQKKGRRVGGKGRTGERVPVRERETYWHAGMHTVLAYDTPACLRITPHS